LNNWGNLVTLTKTKFRRISNCGSIIRNHYELPGFAEDDFASRTAFFSNYDSSQTDETIASFFAAEY